jgi:hypothetical protein
MEGGAGVVAQARPGAVEAAADVGTENADGAVVAGAGGGEPAAQEYGPVDLQSIATKENSVSAAPQGAGAQPGSLDDAGYHCRAKVLNAADYGVPQPRPRLFIIGVPKETRATGSSPGLRDVWLSPNTGRLTCEERAATELACRPVAVEHLLRS